MSPPTVALVDDHALIVHALSASLADRGVSCVAVPPMPAGELLAAVIAAEPTVALLDLDLGEFGTSLPLIEPLAAAGIRVLVLTGQTDRLQLGRALKAGALRVIAKGAAFTELVETIQHVAVIGGVQRDPLAAELLAEFTAYERREASARSTWDELTLREQETLAELAQGRTVRDIAHRWIVSETTVRSHVRSILLKFGVQSQLQAVVMAVHHGWVDPEPVLDEGDPEA